MKYAGRPRGVPKRASRANLPHPCHGFERRKAPRDSEACFPQLFGSAEQRGPHAQEPSGPSAGSKNPMQLYAIIDPIQQAAMHTTIVPTSTHVVLNFLPMIQYMKPKTMSWGRHGMIMSK